jgi:hypothetical protein
MVTTIAATVMPKHAIVVTATKVAAGQAAVTSRAIPARFAIHPLLRDIAAPIGTARHPGVRTFDPVADPGRGD